MIFTFSLKSHLWFQIAFVILYQWHVLLRNIIIFNHAACVWIQSTTQQRYTIIIIAIIPWHYVWGFMIVFNAWVHKVIWATNTSCNAYFSLPIWHIIRNKYLSFSFRCHYSLYALKPLLNRLIITVAYDWRYQSMQRDDEYRSKRLQQCFLCFCETLFASTSSSGAVNCL